MHLPNRRTSGLAVVLIAVMLVVGSGAFDAVTAERSATISVAGDDSALLAISPHSTAHPSWFGSGDTISITVGQQTTTSYDPLFNITNQGTQPVAVWIEDFDYVGGGDTGDLAGDIVGDVDEDNTANVTFFNAVWGGSESCENGVPSLEDQGNAVELDAGETLVVSLQANASDVSGEEADLLDEMVIHADASVEGVTEEVNANC